MKVVYWVVGLVVLLVKLIAFYVIPITLIGFFAIYIFSNGLAAGVFLIILTLITLYVITPELITVGESFSKLIGTTVDYIEAKREQELK